jgi:phospholipase/carboxylesterase
MKKDNLAIITYPDKVLSKRKWCIIFLHGLGSHASDLLSFPEWLDLPFKESIQYIFPQAPLLPITINAGEVMPAWYDIKDIDFEKRTDKTTLENSLKLLWKLINGLIAEGIPSHKIIIGGFSQGGAMSLSIGIAAVFNYFISLGGIICLSGYCLDLEKIKQKHSSLINLPPLFMAHGKQDVIIPYNIANKHSKFFSQQGWDLQWFEDDILGHSLGEQEIFRLREWLTKKIMVLP